MSCRRVLSVVSDRAFERPNGCGDLNGMTEGKRHVSTTRAAASDARREAGFGGIRPKAPDVNRVDH